MSKEINAIVGKIQLILKTYMEQPKAKNEQIVNKIIADIKALNMFDKVTLINRCINLKILPPACVGGNMEGLVSKLNKCKARPVMPRLIKKRHRTILGR